MKHKGKWLILFGLLLIAAALFLTAYNLKDERRAEQSALQAINKLEEYLPSGTAAEPPTGSAGEQAPWVAEDPVVVPDYILCPEIEMPVETIDGVDYIGVLRIPTLELELPVISQWNYPNLKIAPCRYTGSAYLNSLIICGHNYTSHFGNLKDLRAGDVVTFTDMAGNVFTYKMVQRETLLPTSIEEMESGNWDLTLFTCTIGGRSRVTVRFELLPEG